MQSCMDPCYWHITGILSVNDIHDNISSLQMFADDCVLYHGVVIQTSNDHIMFKGDQIAKWAKRELNR